MYIIEKIQGVVTMLNLCILLPSFIVHITTKIILAICTLLIIIFDVFGLQLIEFFLHSDNFNTIIGILLPFIVSTLIFDAPKFFEKNAEDYKLNSFDQKIKSILTFLSTVNALALCLYPLITKLFNRLNLKNIFIKSALSAI